MMYTPCFTPLHAARILTLLTVILSVQGAPASVLDIADQPLITENDIKPKPNMLVIMDSSQSMNFEVMPDRLRLQDAYNSMPSAEAPGNNNFTAGIYRLGYKSIQCNGIAYDPSYTYTPPLRPNGTRYPNMVFTAASFDGFLDLNSPGGDTRKTTANLNTKVLDFVNDGNSNPATLTIRYQDSMKRPFGSNNASVPYFKVRTSSSLTPNSLTVSTQHSITLSTRMGVNLGANSFIPGDSITFQSSQTSASNYFRGDIKSWNASTGVLTLTITARSGSSAQTDWFISFPGQIYYSYTGNQASNWTYTSAGDVIKTTNFYKECTAKETDAVNTANTGVFELNAISSNSSADQQTNYANWFSYYRTRKLTMRTAMGAALNNLDDGFRVGYMTIHGLTTDATRFAAINDFTPAHKTTFYSKLYGGSEQGGTPLRRALSEAGRYFANKAGGNQADPMQYACQRNFAFVTTDGYWTAHNDTANLSGSKVGNADGSTIDGVPPSVPYRDTYSDTLADVAYYYYQNDLRTTALRNCTGANGADVCANILKPWLKDTATHQHMTTYTIGMGVKGTLDTTRSPNNVSWTNAQEGKSTTVDDLWHAAVNGRGDFYSTQTAHELVTAIQSIVSTVQDIAGAGAGVSTTALDLVQDESDIVYKASYTTGSWFGDILAYTLDTNTAEPTQAPPIWSAREQLNLQSASNRKIYFKNGNAMGSFDLATLTTAGLAPYFKGLCSASPAKLSQCSGLGTAQQNTINAGDALINYLRGDSSQDASNAAEPLFRRRINKLGDIINSKPIHVGQPKFLYVDTGYSAFQSAQASRTKVLYAGANDGMLHAFDAATGEELWAYVPTAVMPNMYKLADAKYGSSVPHQYYVDGKTVQGDIQVDGVWKTILVGGLNKGGRSYYALDITDPSAPLPLWEFSDNNLGLTYSDPIITKLADGTWTVAFSSGYNNVDPGDGLARLFVLNAATGAVLKNIATSAGSTTTPAGMAKINVWVSSPQDNTAHRFYGGDLLGNVWRFDLQNNDSADVLATMEDADGNPQPITTEPKLREYDKKPIVVVATGQYLGRNDISTTQVHSIAAIRDPLTSGWGSVRGNTTRFKKIEITKSDTSGSGAAVAVDWNSDAGWWGDFPDAGERIVLPMEWDGVRLVAASAIPSGDQCQSGGSSWLYYFNLAGGKTTTKLYSSEALIVGFSIVRTTSGQPKIIVTKSDGTVTEEPAEGSGETPDLKPPRRISWRELQ